MKTRINSLNRLNKFESRSTVRSEKCVHYFILSPEYRIFSKRTLIVSSKFETFFIVDMRLSNFFLFCFTIRMLHTSDFGQ